jgi:hypothetical protein
MIVYTDKTSTQLLIELTKKQTTNCNNFSILCDSCWILVCKNFDLFNENLLEIPKDSK